MLGVLHAVRCEEASVELFFLRVTVFLCVMFGVLDRLVMLSKDMGNGRMSIMRQSKHAKRLRLCSAYPSL